MKITGKNSVAFFLKLAIELILLINILTLLALPFLLNILYENAGTPAAGSVSSQSSQDPSSYVEESSAYDERSSAIIPKNSKWILLSEIPKESYSFMLGFLYFSGIGTAMMLFLVRKVLKNLQRDVILDHANAGAFKLLALSSFILVISFIVKILFYNTFLTMFCFFIFIILGLFCLVLSEVFRQGAVVKEENELTI